MLRGDGNPIGSPEVTVIVLGLILLVLGLLLKISILWTIGIVLLVVGAVLVLMGSMGRAVGGRRHYY
jgi:uncharacterized membrane protein HdeD (DUF308 family)